MTAASPGPGPNIFSILSGQNEGLDRARRETFLFSLLGQAAIVGVLIYFTSCLIRNTPEIASRLPKFNELPLVFSGHGGGGGGNHDPLPASRGNLPKASLDPQLAPPTVILPTEPPKLAVAETVRVAPSIELPQGGQVGDPLSQFSPGAVQWIRRSRRNRTRVLRWRRTVNRAGIRPRSFGNLSGRKDGRDGPASDF